MKKIEKEKIPEDLKVKIGTEDEDLWTNVRDETKKMIKQEENNLKIQKAILELAISKITEEQAKMKK